jgi:hypothetical protein
MKDVGLDVIFDAEHIKKTDFQLKKGVVLPCRPQIWKMQKGYYPVQK